ncbi:MAG: efflux RND transporter periplasmic adaptor subunit [Bryobacteraceae bacterium]
MSSKASIIATAALAVGIMAACSARGGSAHAAQEAAPSLPVVAVSKAAKTDLSSTIALTAEFSPYQEVDVMAKISGYVREIRVDIGDRVKAGDVLATLEIPEMQDDLSRASASIEEATAELAAAKDELQRAQSQHDMDHLSYSRILDVSKREKGLVPQQQVDEAHSRDLVAEAQVSSAKSHIAAFEQRMHVSQAEQARYKTMYQYAVITAPFSGVVTRRYANKGSLIQAGTSSQTQAMPLVRISENGRLRLDLPVPESAVPSVRLGQLVDVKISALNRTFPGHVSRFEDKLDESTRTMKTEVDVPNPSLTLVPGMYAEVDLTTGQRKNVLSVPVEAVDGSGDAGRIFRVSSSGELQALNVRLGLENAQRIEIRDSSLQDGDEVVVGSRSGLKDGVKVQPREVSLNGNAASKE